MSKFCDAPERYFAARDYQTAEEARLLAEAGVGADEGEETAETKRIRRQIRAQVRRASLKKFGPAKRPDWQLVGGAGTGKTSAFVREYRRRPALWGRHIWIVQPTRAKCDETASDINIDAPEGMPVARTIKGREAKGMCEYPRVAERIGGIVPSTYASMCRDEHSQCEHYNECPYIGQFTNQSAKEPRVWVVTHQRLCVGQPPTIALPAPEIVVVDERLTGALTEITDVKHEAFGREEAYFGNKEDRLLAPNHAALGRQVAAIIMTGGDVLARLRAEIPLGEGEDLMKRLKEAAGAAGRAADNGGITPFVVGATKKGGSGIGMLIERIQARAAKGVHLVLRQLARDLEHGRSIAVTWERVSTTKDGAEMAGRIRHHGRKPSVAAAQAAMLVLDADAIPEVNHILLERDFRTLEIQGRRLGHFTQCHDHAYPKSSLLPQSTAPAQISKSNSVIGRMLHFARTQHDGGRRKVLVIANLPVHLALRRAAGIRDPDDGELDVTVIEQGLELTHFGAYIGRDDWKGFDVLMVIGREQPKAESIEAMARCIYGDRPEIQLELPGKYVRARRPYCGREEVAEFWTHSDPRVRSLLEVARERQTGQGIDRLRLMFRRPDGREPTIFVLSSLPLPGVIPAVLDPAEDILAGGSRIERAVAGGLFTSNAAILAALHPALWGTAKAAERDLQARRAKVVQVFDSKENTRPSHMGSMRGAGVFLNFNGLSTRGVFRRRGSDGFAPKWSEFVVIPTKMRRADIVITKAAGAEHIDQIELKGEAAEVIAVARGNDEAQGIVRSLSNLTDSDRKTLDPRRPEDAEMILADVFAMRPSRHVAWNGTETWTDYAGNVISRPIDAPPLPVREPRPEWREPWMCQVDEKRPDGTVVVEWYDVRTGQPIADPRPIPEPDTGLDPAA